MRCSCGKIRRLSMGEQIMSKEIAALEEAEEVLRESIRLFKEISKMANTIRVIAHSAANGNDIGTAFAALDVAEKYAENATSTSIAIISAMISLSILIHFLYLNKNLQFP